MKKHNGFGGIPITETGKVGSPLLGIVTSRDIDFITDLDIKLSEVMVKELIVAEGPISLSEAEKILKGVKVGKLPIVNSSNDLIGLCSRSDLLKARDNPLITTDKKNKLLCGASVGTRELDKERIIKLYEAGIDVLVIDSSQGDSI